MIYNFSVPRVCVTDVDTTAGSHLAVEVSGCSSLCGLLRHRTKEMRMYMADMQMSGRRYVRTKFSVT